MVGSGIKKYAKEKGLNVKNGVAYGIYRGYMITLQEGAGWKSVDFAVCMTDEMNGVVQGQLGQMLTEEFKKEYRIMELRVGTKRVAVRFFDQSGTMPKMEAFIDILCNKLSALEVPGQNYCVKCGEQIDSSLVAENVLVEGAVYQIHHNCADEMQQEMNAARSEAASKGNLATGIIGAVLGGIIGAIPWAIASFNGWFVGWFGFLIGFVALKGYELLKGKDSKAKAVVIMLVTVLAVLLAEFASWVVAIMMAYEFTLLESFFAFIGLLAEDPSVLGQIFANVALGLLFAGLGIFNMVRDIFARHSKKNTSLTRM